MTFVWLIIALGILVFLTQLGSGLETYLSTKNPPRKDDSDGEKQI